LAKATSDENAHLVHRVKELEVEITVWKQALSATRGSQDVTSRREVTFAPPQKSLALCVIDGTRCIFSSTYITQGEEGGRKAGQEIVRIVTDHLANDKSLPGGNVNLSITLYVTKTRSRKDLIIGEYCTGEQFDGFIVGLNETPYLNIVEVNNKKDASKKIEEHLQLFAGLSETVRIFFSGLYRFVVADTDLMVIPGARWKWVGVLVYYSYSRSMRRQEQTNHPAEPQRPIEQRICPPPFSHPLYRRTFFYIKYQSLLIFYRLIAENPPPCNEYYLMESCSREGRCKYSHEYDLTDEQLVTLAKNAKQSPCWFLNNDGECPHGTNCCWGHVCPFGMKCHHLYKDNCRFKGCE
ncbi:hypothetical protein F5148DRAFT_1317821, partial [Russula earlei]